MDTTPSVGCWPRGSDWNAPGEWVCLGMEPLSSSQIRALKARAQLMKATVKVGKEGLSSAFIAALDEALKHNELIKVKFDEFKEEKKTLAPELAKRTASHLVTRVGNVAVLYRPGPQAEPAPEP